MYSPKEFGLDKPVYDVPETLWLLNSSRTALYANVAAGNLRLTKNGRKSLFLAVDIAEFLSSLRDGSGAQ